MVLKEDLFGKVYHKPPYMKAEEAEFYRRVGGGLVTVARPANDAPKSPSPEQPSPAKGDA